MPVFPGCQQAHGAEETDSGTAPAAGVRRHRRLGVTTSSCCATTTAGLFVGCSFRNRLFAVHRHPLDDLKDRRVAVSYTHLTLPTIYSV